MGPSLQLSTCVLFWGFLGLFVPTVEGTKPRSGSVSSQANAICSLNSVLQPLPTVSGILYFYFVRITACMAMPLSKQSTAATKLRLIFTNSVYFSGPGCYHVQVTAWKLVVLAFWCIMAYIFLCNICGDIWKNTTLTLYPNGRWLAISLSLLWEFRFPYELRLTYLKRYVKRSRHGTDGQTDRQTDGRTDGQHRYMMGPPSRKDGPIIRCSKFIMSAVTGVSWEMFSAIYKVDWLTFSRSAAGKLFHMAGPMYVCRDFGHGYNMFSIQSCSGINCLLHCRQNIRRSDTWTWNSFSKVA